MGRIWEGFVRLKDLEDFGRGSHKNLQDFGRGLTRICESLGEDSQGFARLCERIYKDL